MVSHFHKEKRKLIFLIEMVKGDFEMGKLYFRFGVMGSSKTANALMVRYNYLEKEKNVILLKPKLDNRDGEKIVKSRIGIESECIFIEDFLKEAEDDKTILHHCSCIIIDEAQFMKAKQVETFAYIVDEYNIPVICYGLKTDFKGELFEGSRRLIELSDVIEEIPTVCWCGCKAKFNARISNGKVLRDGEQVQLGGNESYVGLCRKHYREGLLGEENKNHR